MSADAVISARERLIKVVLRRVSSERDEPNAHYDAELEYCDDLIDAAAKDLAIASRACEMAS